MDVELFFEKLWADYIDITPQAERIRQLFLTKESQVINDHVAFRTFSDTPLNISNLQPLVLALGYQVQDAYTFEQKKLTAVSYIHQDSTVPKIFISEVERHKLSDNAQRIMAKYCDQIVKSELSHEVFWSARHWSMPTFEDYSELKKESEYAAWLLAIGLRVNHFTVSVDSLTSTDSIRDVLQWVQDEGFDINESGGRVKGSPDSLLEQGSTMADKMPMRFGDGEQHVIPTCFYEFAKRYVNGQGERYQGFIAANADKIFESTFA